MNLNQHAEAVFTHVILSVSIGCVLFAGILVPSANDGRGNGIGDVVHGWVGVVERECGAEVVGGVLG